jgi:hypothetical protein
MLKIYNCQIGENSPNLVTLTVLHSLMDNFMYVSFSNMMCLVMMGTMFKDQPNM